ncbi:MAG: hypothetical protein JEZ12_11845 [Desulfobacterium sp.]|nr:hypothetical protein [Desulfobacterium sp.]
MTASDIDRFTEIMAGMAENYPNTHLSKNGLTLRFKALKAFDIDQVSQAAIALIQTHKFNTMPTTADIIAAMGQGLNVEDRAEIEAVKVLEFFRLYGRNGDPVFEDPTTKHLMESRWRYRSWASTITESDLKWWRVEFTRSYISHHAGMKTGYYIPAMGKIKQLARMAAKSLSGREVQHG